MSKHDREHRTFTCTPADIPEGNPFGIGATPETMINHAGLYFSILTPRMPMIVSRGEALNLIGNCIVLGSLRAEEVDEMIRECEGQRTPRVASDGRRVSIALHPPPILMDRRATLQLIAAITVRAGLTADEIDAAVARIEGTRGLISIDDVATEVSKGKPN